MDKSVSVTVTNPPLSLLDIFLVSQPFVHVPEKKGENLLQPTSHWWILASIDE